MIEQINQTIIVDNQFALINKLQELASVLHILLLGACAVLVIGGQGLIIHYIKNHTPKDRPINRMFLIDLVSL